MKYLKITKQWAFLALAAVMFTACEKAKTTEPMGAAGQTLVKIIGGDNPYGIAKYPIDFVAKPVQLMVVQLRRDVANETDLNKTMTVIVKDDTANVRAANPAYKQFPTAWYTIQGTGFVKTGGQGGIYTFTFKPGEFAKEIYITVPDATVLDPSSLYGLGFSITSADAGGVITKAARNLVIEIGAKNAYDGIYSVESGLVTRYTAPGVPAGDVLSGNLAGNPDVYMVTVGAYTNEIPGSGSAGRLEWAFGNASGVAGIDGLKITVDPSTNLTNAVSSGYATSNATLTNWAGHVNKYDPATKTYYLALRWNPTANVREYEVVLKYKSPR